MFCANCGNRVPDGTRFCRVCGADCLGAPVEQKKSHGGRLVLIVVLCAVVLAAAAAGALWFEGVFDRLPTAAVEYASGEDAADAFWSAVERGELDDALGAFASLYASGDAERLLREAAAAPDDGELDGSETGGATGGGASEPAPARYAAADAAVEAFLRALSQDDVDGALDTFAVEEYWEYGDWLDYFALGAITRGEYFADNNPLIEQLFLAHKRGLYSDYIGVLVNSLFAGKNDLADSLLSGAAVAHYDDLEETYAEYDQLMRGFSFRDVEFIGYAAYALSADEHERNLRPALVDALGCSDVAEYIYLIRYQDDYYISSMTLYQYESGWKIRSLMGLNGLTYWNSFTRIDALNGLTPDDAVNKLLDEYGGYLESYTILR